MRKLVIFYSYEGNTRLLAKAIAEAVGAGLLELKPKKDIKSKSWMKYFWGGRQVVMKSKPELSPFDENPMDYNLLFIGTPVWAFTYAPALRSFFTKHKPTGKKIAVFCCHEGAPKDTLAHMEKALEGNEIIGRNDFFAPLRKNKENTLERARKWAREVAQPLG